MNRRGRRAGSQGRAEGRVRGRVRERVQGSERGRMQGRERSEGRGAERNPERRSQGRKSDNFDIGAIEGYAHRLTDSVGGTSHLAGAASGLAGAASGFAGGSLASRFLGSNSEGSEEDFRKEVLEHLDLIDRRLQLLEEQMNPVHEEGYAEDSESDLGEEGEPIPE